MDQDPPQRTYPVTAPSCVDDQDVEQFGPSEVVMATSRVDRGPDTSGLDGPKVKQAPTEGRHGNRVDRHAPNQVEIARLVSRHPGREHRLPAIRHGHLDRYEPKSVQPG